MAESISSLTGHPIEITLAGKKHRFRQLSIAELFGKFEAEVLNEWTERVQKMAEGLKGKDKIDFLSHEVAHPLSNEDSTELIRVKMNSSRGIEMVLSLTHIQDDQLDVLPDAVALVSKDEDKIAVKRLIQELTGVVGVKEEGKDSPKA